MSTIAGLVRFTDRPVDRSDLAGAARYLADPGVGEAVFWCEGSAGLVARQRFSTPEDRFERQPWVGAGGRLVLVFDGRLDNREEIIDALGLSVDPTDVLPDGALLLRSFERWGESALPRFLGPLSLALWDGAERRLLLARDHLGRRALYVHQGQGFVAFASTLQALLAMPQVPRRLNEERLGDFLVLNFKGTEETLYDGLLRVPAATALAFDRQGVVRRNQYWAFDLTRRIRFRSDGEYVEAAREQLDRAVARRLRSDGPVSATMSGGLDSSAVATSAARQMAPNRLLTLTAVPPPGFALSETPRTQYVDETPYVRAIAAMHPNMDLQLIWSEGTHALERDPTALFEAGGLPIYGPTNFGWFAPLTEASLQAGSRVVLGGQAGNAMWSWNGLERLGELFSRGRWIRLLRELDAAGKIHGGRKHLLRSHVIHPMIPAWLGRIYLQMKAGHPQRWNRFSGINPQFAVDIGLYQRNLQAGQGPAMRDFRPQSLVRLDRLVHNNGSDGRAVLRSLFGIEDRDPLADRNLVEFFLALPSDQFLRDGVTRRLTRHALVDRLPKEVIEKNSFGQQNPEWFSRMAADKIRMMDDLNKIRNSPLASRCIDVSRLSGILENFHEGGSCSFSSIHYLLPRALHVGLYLVWLEKKLD
ncbi:asparagine synthase-related protein [Rhodospirillum sp. A1_3_36]|uniref:asparagine synthase-related protein n=1 Tax=Rhodospirillum sp. A1_3_36 TaxID=3391666 RepID=UPI0039A473FC